MLKGFNAFVETPGLYTRVVLIVGPIQRVNAENQYRASIQRVHAEGQYSESVKRNNTESIHRINTEI